MLRTASRALARRLRVLREELWPDVRLTQSQLAEAIGVSTSLISAWENVDKPVNPPVKRLETYATLFAVERSREGRTLRVLPFEELTDEERHQRQKLLHELLWLREGNEPAVTQPAPVLVMATDLWTFPRDQQITIVCASLPEDLRAHLTYANPESAAFTSLYTYADPDALIELFGHIRARNPDNQVSFGTSEGLRTDDYTSHLVLLGNVGWNSVTQDLIERVELPVWRVDRDDDSEDGGFHVRQGRGSWLIRPNLDSAGHLLEDVAHLYRGLNPFNHKRTVTVCTGMYGQGTLGAVRALTDVRFRDRNIAYVRERFCGAEAFSIVSRVPVVVGQVLTPDWTFEENRLHEWPEGP